MIRRTMPPLTVDEARRGMSHTLAEIRRQLHEEAEEACAHCYHLLQWHWECEEGCSGDRHVGYVEIDDRLGVDLADSFREHLLSAGGAEYVGHEAVPLRAGGLRHPMAQVIGEYDDGAAVALGDPEPATAEQLAVKRAGYLLHFTTRINLDVLRDLVVAAAKTPARGWRAGEMQA